MYITLSRNESRPTFNVWVYGDDKLVRGSGLFVGETGLGVNHHFLAPRDDHGFRFTAGTYRLEVFAHLVGSRKPILLFTQSLELSQEIGREMDSPDAGLYFDWGPDSSRYHSHLDRRPEMPLSNELRRLLTDHGKQS